MRTTPTRCAFTLVEVLVCLGILAVLIGLVAAAVQRVRLAALQVQSTNNLRQIALGLQGLAESKGGKLGVYPDKHTTCTKTSNGGWTNWVPDTDPSVNTLGLYTDLLWWTLGYKPSIPEGVTDPEAQSVALMPPVKCYTSPADPSLSLLPRAQFPAYVMRAATSYSYNIQFFSGVTAFPQAILDGTSNTVGFGEGYFLCGVQGGLEHRQWNDVRPPVGPPPYRMDRRATFADPAAEDVYPYSNPAGRTVASQPGRTFQVRPRVEDADGKVLQTPFPAGLPVALFDGGVRTLSPGIDEGVFWGLVTPAGGEIPGDF